ncbi:TPA: hypothetical protein N2R10_005768, partial [Citrobacter freundii]|nr:hypothetical protein [Citrobacter freundii]
GGDMVPMAAALNLLLINLSQRFDVNRLEQLPLRQLLIQVRQLRKQYDKPPKH